METYDIYEAKRNWSAILARVGRGESFIVAKSGKPIAKIIPFSGEYQPTMRTGFLKGQMSVPDDFDTMGADSIANLFEGFRRNITVALRGRGNP
ncbi:MAG: type II toxin-antitoxin system prevent-host-death family antitoxin [Desulfovibrio sp.]|nr:type II toxin-antitoxin system prevent-host-death family antitoxin [Desulfovibrio sp.]